VAKMKKNLKNVYYICATNPRRC